MIKGKILHNWHWYLLIRIKFKDMNLFILMSNRSEKYRVDTQVIKTLAKKQNFNLEWKSLEQETLLKSNRFE